MTKTKKSIAIIILMLVLSCALFGCIQTQATKADFRTYDFFIGKYKYVWISSLSITEDEINPHVYLSFVGAEALTENRVYWRKDCIGSDNSNDYMEFAVDSVVIEDVLKFINGFEETIILAKNELVLGKDKRYQREKSIYDGRYNELEMHFLAEEGTTLPYVLFGSYDGYETPCCINIQYVKYLTGSDGKPYMYEITIRYDYVK